MSDHRDKTELRMIDNLLARCELLEKFCLYLVLINCLGACQRKCHRISDQRDKTELRMKDNLLARCESLKNKCLYSVLTNC